jgi:hypothetical protein
MKVTFTETGGWANVTRSCTVDTISLPRTTAFVLEAACRKALSLAAIAVHPNVRDARTLTLVVVANGERRSASFSEAEAPPELQPVIEILRPLCRPVPAKWG